LRQEDARDVEGAVEIGAEDVVPLGFAGFVEAGARDYARGVVEGGGDARLPVPRGLGPGRGGGMGPGGGAAGGLGAGGGAVGGGDGGVEARSGGSVGGAAADGDARAGGGEARGDGEADAAAGAGDDGDLAGERGGRIRTAVQHFEPPFDIVIDPAPRRTGA